MGGVIGLEFPVDRQGKFLVFRLALPGANPLWIDQECVQIGASDRTARALVGGMTLPRFLWNCRFHGYSGSQRFAGLVPSL
jgi:hypothetical protein